jgi:phosphoribosylamine--glycine ligase
MKVLVIGGGGREHALAWKIAQSSRLSRLYCAPGNAGTAAIAENLAIAAEDLEGLAAAAERHRIDLTIVGPEDPLAEGITDLFDRRGLPIIGPTRAAARIEADKAYAKTLMNRALVPTAEARIFDNHDHARAYVATRDSALVVKAAGLAKGKGVLLCQEPAEALIWIEKIMVDGIFGDAGQRVVVEELLHGQEVSVICLVDGHNIYVLESAQDYKPVGDGDTGPNTGGMGSYSPAGFLDDHTLTQIERDILVPTVEALRREGAPFRGVLYAGLMLTPGGPKVLEFNCRFGDPETQPLMMRLESDLLDALEAMRDGRLDQISLRWSPRAAVGVVLASGGYPGTYNRGKPISGLETANMLPDVAVFHSGTALSGGRVVTAGGRVLCATALGETLKAARQRAYEAVEHITFDGAFCRRDIAAPGRPHRRFQGTEAGLYNPPRP